MHVVVNHLHLRDPLAEDHVRQLAGGTDRSVGEVIAAAPA